MLWNDNGRHLLELLFSWLAQKKKKKSPALREMFSNRRCVLTAQQGAQRAAPPPPPAPQRGASRALTGGGGQHRDASTSGEDGAFKDTGALWKAPARLRNVNRAGSGRPLRFSRLLLVFNLRNSVYRFKDFSNKIQGFGSRNQLPETRTQTQVLSRQLFQSRAGRQGQGVLR